MKQNKIEEGRYSIKGHGLGTVTRGMVRKRASELAVINGRGPKEILESDLAQARRELTGKERLNPEETAADRLPEASRWEEVPESTGQQAPTVSASDEQTFTEQLIEEGVEDAEQEQMLKATRASLKRDRES